MVHKNFSIFVFYIYNKIFLIEFPPFLIMKVIISFYFIVDLFIEYESKYHLLIDFKVEKRIFNENFFDILF
jgi:hypothetical protein